jgi:hypothetical protein
VTDRRTRRLRECRQSAPVIYHLDGRFTDALDDVDHDRRGAGVFEHVRQRFLQDAITVQQHTVGRHHVGSHSIPVQLDGHPRGTNRFDERLHIVGTRRGSQRASTLALLAQHAEHPAQFVEGAATGCLDRLQRLLRFLGLGVDHVCPHSRLHRDDAHRVGNDIVQLLGDPAAFVADRDARIGISLPLELRRRGPRPRRAVRVDCASPDR